MMLPSLVLALLVPPVPARLVGASLFKNGFAVVTRQILVASPGTTTVVPIPQGALGTLWFAPSEGLRLDSVVVEDESEQATRPADSLDAILGANVGRTVTLILADVPTPKRLACRLLSAAGSIVVVEAGTTRAIPKTTIMGVEGKGLKSDLPAPGSHRVLRLRTAGRPGTVTVVGLERGLAWAPSYAVTLLPGGKELSLVAKATVLNDLERLGGVECRFVTGFPNIPFMNELDPLVAPLETARILGVAAPGGFGGSMGGLRGGLGANRFAGQQTTFVPFDASDPSLLAAGQGPNGAYREELFFYRQPEVVLSRGARAAYTLFRTNAAYETIYTWDIGDPSPGASQFAPRIVPSGGASAEEVWQTLRFRNTAKLPLTTGPATTFSEGEIVGQDTLRYASPAQPVELRVTRSLDLAADATEEEASRERGFVRRSDNYPIFDRVTVKGTLALTNRKPKAVRVRIRKAYTGEWISGEGDPKIVATAAGVRQTNPTGLAEWTVDLAPGTTSRLTYSVRLLVSP